MNVFILNKIAKSIIKEEINIIGIHCSQWIGKTTLNTLLYNELCKDYNVIVLSLYDNYVPYKEMNNFLENCNDNLYSTLINLKNNKSLYNKFRGLDARL